MTRKNRFIMATFSMAFLFSGLNRSTSRAAPKANPSPSQSAPSDMQHDRHHKDELPRVVFLNQSAVLIASKKHKEKYKEHQTKLIEMMKMGVMVLACPDCMKQYGVKASDLIDGVQVGKPGQTQES